MGSWNDSGLEQVVEVVLGEGLDVCVAKKVVISAP